MTAPDIVCFSSIDWQYLWQVHQEVMSRFSRAGSRVLYIESTGLRAPSWADAPRLWRRLQHARGTGAEPHPTHGVTVLPPVVLPFPYSGAARAVNRARLLPRIRQWLDARPAPVAWIFLPTPLSLELSRAINPALTVYYCVDDLRRSSRAAGRVAASEEALLRTADVVFVTSTALQEQALRFRREAYLLPAGVDAARFASPCTRPADLQHIPGPIAGYAGGQPPWLDVSLLKDVATLMPETHVVLVGPSHLADFDTLPNVHVLGPRPHDQLPGYLQAFDVALIPYERSAYTDAIYPAKLNEYLAAGLPIVSTSLRELRQFDEQHPGLVSFGDDAKAFAAAIRSSLRAARDGGEVARRRDIARASDWDVRFTAMDAIVERALAARSTPAGHA